MRHLVFILPFVMVAAASAADADFKLSDPDAPIEYSAKDCNADQKSGSLVCSGSVTIRQGNLRLRADTVRIHSPDNKTVDRVFAKGQVVVDSPSGTATGDSGVYEVEPRRITLEGNVVLVRRASVMRGAKLSVDLISGVAKLNGVENGGRVQGLFTPKKSGNSDK
jgi:lipopolysaccharide export system protein LptA